MNPSHLSRLRISLCSVWKLKIEYNNWFLLFLGRHGWLRCRFCPFVTTPSGLQRSLYFVWVGVQKVGWDGICLLSCLGKRWGRHEHYKVAAETKLFFYDFLGKKINSGQTTSLLAFFFFCWGLNKITSFWTKINCFGQNTLFHLKKRCCFDKPRLIRVLIFLFNFISQSFEFIQLNP
jgi:hypothetical protein